MTLCVEQPGLHRVCESFEESMQVPVTLFLAVPEEAMLPDKVEDIRMAQLQVHRHGLVVLPLRGKYEHCLGAWMPICLCMLVVGWLAITFIVISGHCTVHGSTW